MDLMSRRRALMASVETEPVSPIPTGYVTDGLLLWLDAKCNTRHGFEQNPEYWEDLSGNERDYYLGPAAKASFANNALYFAPGVAHDSIETQKPFTGAEISAVRTLHGSIEVVANPAFQRQYGFILGFGNGYPNIAADRTDSANVISFDVFTPGGRYSLRALSGLHYYNSSKMVDGVVQEPIIYATTWSSRVSGSLFAYGNNNIQYSYEGYCSVLRVYNRELTDAELLQNWRRDNARYNIT